jgi:hypothetical protein
MPVTQQLTKKNQRLKKKCITHWHENLMLLQLNHLSSKEVYPITDIRLGGDECPFCNAYLIVLGAQFMKRLGW